MKINVWTSFDGFDPNILLTDHVTYLLSFSTHVDDVSSRIICEESIV